MEFKAIFKRLCDNFGLDLKPTTAYNPTANGIVERVHQTLGNMLRTHELEDKELDPHEPFKMYLSSVAWAICSTYHTTLDATPGQVVFGRDTIGQPRHSHDAHVDKGHQRQGWGTPPLACPGEQFNLGAEAQLCRGGRATGVPDGPIRRTVTPFFFFFAAQAGRGNPCS